jgi:polynucleotide 5'-kinase involved in rRNA processing
LHLNNEGKCRKLTGSYYYISLCLQNFSLPAKMGSSKPGILQLVRGDGEFQTEALENFVKEHKIASAGVDYQVIAITGPQSSGKSTLMNAVVRLVVLLYIP